jgi:murein DD-endopeptidase MepM/ murein hydrolase activator NlpD
MRKAIAATFLALLCAATASAERIPDGGGPARVGQAQPCLSASQRQQIKADIDRNVARLYSEGLLTTGLVSVSLGWPLKNVTPRGDPGVHVVTSYVDHDPLLALDYACGERAFPNGHTGTDFRPYPFGRLKMVRNEVHVVAAAPGTIVGKEDGHSDDMCVNGGPWNAVYVQHADGSTAWYGHLKNGSVTSKSIGDGVAAGEYLGVVGNSGSLFPKLHFELHDATDTVVDPYAGACNPTTVTSWWTAQPPYPDPAILKLSTHSANPTFSGCPGVENPYFSIHFQRPASGWFGAFWRDFPPDMPTVFTVYRPDGSTADTWTDSGLGSFAYEAGSLRSFYLSAGQPVGRWNLRAVFNGVTYDHGFYLLDPGDLIFQDGFQLGL